MKLKERKKFERRKKMKLLSVEFDQGVLIVSVKERKKEREKERERVSERERE